MTISILDEKQLVEKLNQQQNPFFEDYYAFYSSWFGGIIKNPKFMLLPIDDHMVHRGDGVFEAIKVINRSVYLLDEHLQRLFDSAEKIALPPLYTVSEMKQVILETLRVANQSEALIRLFLSRGPGNFSVNPYDSLGSQLYVVITKLKLLAAEKYAHGVLIGKSNLPAKASWLAQIKSCNYLQNVLMKKEAVDRKLDFVIGVDEHGYITEGATENIVIVDQDNMILHPSLNYILKGTMMVRACELAQENGIKVAARSISIDDLLSAKEVMMLGTTLNVLSVVKFEAHRIGNGRPGPMAKLMEQLLQRDISNAVRGTTF